MFSVVAGENTGLFICNHSLQNQGFDSKALRAYTSCQDRSKQICILRIDWPNAVFEYATSGLSGQRSIYLAKEFISLHSCQMVVLRDSQLMRATRRAVKGEICALWLFDTMK